MPASTNIAWCNASWSPWIGCQAVSAACAFCYAEALTQRWGGDFAVRRRTSAAYWKQLAKWQRDARSKGTRLKVFPSMCDPFDNWVPQEWRHDMWDEIKGAPDLDFLLLTKRPQNISRMLPANWGDGWPNVWLGATVENVAEQRRIAHLRAVPAVLRFLSCEPLLEPITPDLRGISWVIVGGESGPHARPMYPEWVIDLRDQCRAAGVAFFMKQTGSARTLWPGVTGKGDDPAQWSHGFRVQEFPKND